MPARTNPNSWFNHHRAIAYCCTVNRAHKILSRLSAAVRNSAQECSGIVPPCSVSKSNYCLLSIRSYVISITLVACWYGKTLSLQNVTIIQITKQSRKWKHPYFNIQSIQSIYIMRGNTRLLKVYGLTNQSAWKDSTSDPAFSWLSCVASCLYCACLKPSNSLTRLEWCSLRTHMSNVAYVLYLFNNFNLHQAAYADTKIE